MDMHVMWTYSPGMGGYKVCEYFGASKMSI